MAARFPPPNASCEGVVLLAKLWQGDYNFLIFKIPTFQKRTPDVFVPSCEIPDS